MENEVQQSGKLDSITQIKILKGAVIALTGGLAVLILLVAFGIGVDKATIVAFFAWFTPVAVNSAKEFYAGEMKE